MNAEDLYKKLILAFPKADAIYEDSIVDIVGYDGLMLLRKEHMIESCGILEGRKLYAV